MKNSAAADEAGFLTASALPVLLAVMLLLTVFSMQVSALLQRIEKEAACGKLMRRLEAAVLRIMREFEDADSGNSKERAARLMNTAELLKRKGFLVRIEEVLPAPENGCRYRLSVGEEGSGNVVSGILALRGGGPAGDRVVFHYTAGGTDSACK